MLLPLLCDFFAFLLSFLLRKYPISNFKFQLYCSTLFIIIIVAVTAAAAGASPSPARAMKNQYWHECWLEPEESEFLPIAHEQLNKDMAACTARKEVASTPKSQPCLGSRLSVLSFQFLANKLIPVIMGMSIRSCHKLTQTHSGIFLRALACVWAMEVELQLPQASSFKAKRFTSNIWYQGLTEDICIYPPNLRLPEVGNKIIKIN